MAKQAFVISFYAAGERRASDSYGDFVATRSEAHDVGREYVAEAAKARDENSDWPCAWINRYTVRRIWLSDDFGVL